MKSGMVKNPTSRKMIFCLKTVVIFCFGFSLGAILNFFLMYQLETVALTRDVLEKQNHFKNPSLKMSLQFHEISNTIEKSSTEISTEASTSAPTEGRGPTILCFILTGPSTLKSTLNVKDTWAQRCDLSIFFSTQDDPVLRPVILDVPEGYNYLWAKTKASLVHLLQHYPDFDWYLKADDDTFVIVENLRYFLRDIDPRTPVYHGLKFKKFVKQGFMSGGGGYVLSREALRRFVDEALKLEDQEKCPNEATRGAEDLQLGQCLEAVGVAAGDSLDSEGKPRFFAHSPISLYYKVPLVNRFHWYWKYLWHKHEVGPDCCSRDVITFHDIDPRMMWTLESLLYRLRIHRDLQPPSRNYSTSTAPSTGMRFTTASSASHSIGVNTIT